jgi:hypothetical protein
MAEDKRLTRWVLGAAGFRFLGFQASWSRRRLPSPRAWVRRDQEVVLGYRLRGRSGAAPRAHCAPVRAPAQAVSSGIELTNELF